MGIGQDRDGVENEVGDGDKAAARDGTGMQRCSAVVIMVMMMVVMMVVMMVIAKAVPMQMGRVTATVQGLQIVVGMVVQMATGLQMQAGMVVGLEVEMKLAT